jgi:hypothetical protein
MHACRLTLSVRSLSRNERRLDLSARKTGNAATVPTGYDIRPRFVPFPTTGIDP